MTTDNKTLADVQPGGRVRLGDGLRPCPFCGHSDFDQWPCEYIDASGANVVRCARCHAAAPMKVWHALSAQPSPGGQGDAQTIAKLRAMMDHSFGGPGFVVYGTAQSIAEVERRLAPGIAASQPGGQDAHELWAMAQLVPGEGIEDGVRRIEAALAARQPVGDVPQGCDACHRTGIRQNDEGRNVFCPDCDLGRAYAGVHLAQEPVGEIVAGKEIFDGERWVPTVAALLNRKGKVGDKLYTAPPAQIADSQPVGMTELGWVLKRATPEQVLQYLEDDPNMRALLSIHLSDTTRDDDEGDTAPPAQAVEMSPEFTDTARAAIAWVLWHHQGGSSPVGQPLRFALGMGQHDRMTDQQIAEAKRFAAWANATTEDFHQRAPAQAVDLGRFRKLVSWVVNCSGHGINDSQRRMGEELLALIDSQAVGNG